MIAAEKLESALYSLHLVIVAARYMAYTDQPKEDIAAILDLAERLPWLIACEGDSTDEYREYLKSIAQQFPAYSLALRAFDDPSQEKTW